MINFKKICRILLLAAFVCTLSGVNSHAWAASAGTVNDEDLADKIAFMEAIAEEEARTSVMTEADAKKVSDADATKIPHGNGNVTVIFHRNKGQPTAVMYSPIDLSIDSMTDADCNPKCGPNSVCVCRANKICRCQRDNTPSAGGNARQSDAAVTGCSSDYGLFSGLITTGRKIFKNLRDLIYVVAGFGIIGVAVGGFFGNLNWKWLGAIVIALVVIASTGEIINMITGCENFTKAMITDTLIHQ